MAHGLKLEEMRALVRHMKSRAQPLRIIQTQEEADRINTIERPYGLQHDWRVGDNYYLLSDVSI